MCAGPSSITQMNSGWNDCPAAGCQGGQRSSDGSSQSDGPSDPCRSAGEPLSTVPWPQFPGCSTCAAGGSSAGRPVLLGRVPPQIFVWWSLPAGLSLPRAALSSQNHSQWCRQATHPSTQPAPGERPPPRSDSAPPGAWWWWGLFELVDCHRWGPTSCILWERLQEV